MERLEALTSHARSVSSRITTLETETEPSRAGCLHSLFEAWVARSPDSPAIISDLEILSYRELDQRANRLARFLRTQGAAPGKLVALRFERSVSPIVAILAILKSGAAYVPIDPSYPDERIRGIFDEAQPVLFLTQNLIDENAGGIAAESSIRIPSDETGVTPENLCYVIYTSGTTGRPKGILTEHRNAYSYARAFNTICGTTPADRVFQGFSLSFDGSVEEIWMAFSNGSALVVGDSRTPRFGDELGEYLAKRQVTYLSTVPTLLSTITQDITSLKTLVVSGEVCPPELVQRWACPAIRMWNVYGPTETTVNTTAAECVPGKRVTIGRALPGYRLYILDEKLQPVPPGTKGELFIGGEMLARGYLGRPDLTSEKFIELPIPGMRQRVYRTGDLVALNAEGELEFFGRIDGQVKIRGHRVELAEIESLLLENSAIRSAAVRLAEKNGIQHLAAYVIPTDPSRELDRAAILAQLDARLPAYMVPGYLDVIAEMPLLTSGKVDRKLLPDPVSPLVKTSAVIVEPETELERKVAAVWKRIFGVGTISVEDDFFLDLGGHSLIAAQTATMLRREIGAQVTVRDVYGFPTIRKLAATIAESQATEGSAPASLSARVRAAKGAKVRTGTAIAQLAAIYLLYGLGSIPACFFFLPAYRWVMQRGSFLAIVHVWFWLLFLTWPIFLTLGIASKWILIGRYKPGKYPLWGWMHFRHWLAGRMQAFSGAGVLSGTPLMSLYFRAMGAKIGKRCWLETGSGGSWDLLTIGDDTSIGSDSLLLGYRIEDGFLHVGGLEIGSRCFVGIHSAVGMGATMEDDSALDDQSLLPDGHVLPRGEFHRGSPAQPAPFKLPKRSRHTLRGRVKLALAQLTLIFFLPFIGIIPLIPFLAFWYYSFVRGGVAVGFFALAISVPLGVVVACLFIAALKKLFLSRVKPGVYSLESVIYVRKWLSDSLMRAARGILLPLYTTIYFPPWLRLLGAKIGARAELSTVWNFAPELVEVGPESFFADGSIIGGRRTFAGSFEIRWNKIGRRSFVGNSAILPVGVSLGDRSLLGVQSIPPLGTRRTPDGSEWLGSPAFSLPHRPKVGNFDESVTFRPTPKLYFQRAIIDGLRILIPGYIGIALSVAGVLALYYTLTLFGVTAMFVLSPGIALILGIEAMFLVAALKQIVMGEYKPVIVPLWSMYVWLNEMVNGAYETVMAPALAPFLGTPFAAPFLRLLGCRIGKHVYLETTLFSEWDLVEIGDYAALNGGAIIQNHLFEDRVMKSSYLKIGPKCTVGHMAVVLYNSEMQKGASLGPLSLLMKGETLTPCTHWHGIPTVRVKTPTSKSAPMPGLRTENIQKTEIKRVRERA